MSAKDFEQTLIFTRYALLISGIKIEPGKWDLVFKILFLNNFLWVISDVLGELYWIVEGILTGKSIPELSFMAPCITITILSAVKVLFIYINQDVLIDIFKKLKNIHPNDDKKMADEITNEGLNDVVRKNVAESTTFLKPVLKFDLILILVVVIAFCSQPGVTMGYQYWKTGTYEVIFPFKVKYFFDPYGNAVWPFVYLHLVWSTFLTFFNTFGTETFFFAFCVYMRMHFRILQKRFQVAVGERKEGQFVEVVKRHQDLIHLADQVELLYSKSTLVNMVISSVLICLSAFNVTSVQDTGVVISFLTFLVMSLTQIFLMCYFGDMLMNSSMELSDGIYNSDWYQADQAMKRNVLFVLIKSRIPCKLTAARFADVNLIAFTKILSRSWSLFALLKTVYN